MQQWCKECQRMYNEYQPNYRLDAVNVCPDCLAKRYGGYYWGHGIITISLEEAKKNFVWMDECQICEEVERGMKLLDDKFEVGVAVDTGDLLFIIPKNARPT